MWLIGCSLPLTRRHSSACGASSLSRLSCAESTLTTLDAGSAATLPEPITCGGCKALMLERALTALVLAETRSRLRVCKLELSMVSNQWKRRSQAMSEEQRMHHLKNIFCLFSALAVSFPTFPTQFTLPTSFTLTQAKGELHRRDLEIDALYDERDTASATLPHHGDDGDRDTANAGRRYGGVGPKPRPGKGPVEEGGPEGPFGMAPSEAAVVEEGTGSLFDLMGHSQPGEEYCEQQRRKWRLKAHEVEAARLARMAEKGKKEAGAFETAAARGPSTSRRNIFTSCFFPH